MYWVRNIEEKKYSVLDIENNIYTEVACLNLDEKEHDKYDGENILYLYKDVPSDKLKEIELSFRNHEYKIKKVNEIYTEKEVYLYKVDEISFEYIERYNYVNPEIYYMIFDKPKKSDIFVLRDLNDNEFNLVKKQEYESEFIYLAFKKWLEKNK